jgi:hypothetical protein
MRIAVSGESWASTPWDAATCCASCIVPPPTQQVKMFLAVRFAAAPIAIATSLPKAKGEGEYTVSTASMSLSATSASSAAVQFSGARSGGSASGLPGAVPVRISPASCLAVSGASLARRPPCFSSVPAAMRPSPWPLPTMARRSPRSGRARAIASAASNSASSVSMRIQPARRKAVS